MIAEGLALIDKAMRHRQPGRLPGPGRDRGACMRGAAEPEDTDWAQIDLLYDALERIQPSPVVTLNRAVAIGKVDGPAAALEMIEPLAKPLSGYFYFYGVEGALLIQLGRARKPASPSTRPIALANTAAEAAHIRMQIDRLVKNAVPAKAK